MPMSYCFSALSEGGSDGADDEASAFEARFRPLGEVHPVPVAAAAAAAATAAPVQTPHVLHKTSVDGNRGSLSEEGGAGGLASSKGDVGGSARVDGEEVSDGGEADASRGCTEGTAWDASDGKHTWGDAPASQTECGREGGLVLRGEGHKLPAEAPRSAAEGARIAEGGAEDAAANVPAATAVGVEVAGIGEASGGGGGGVAPPRKPFAADADWADALQRHALTQLEQLEGARERERALTGAVVAALVHEGRDGACASPWDQFDAEARACNALLARGRRCAAAIASDLALDRARQRMFDARGVRDP